MKRQPLLGALLIITLACAALAQPAWAGPRDQPEPLPGWTHPPKYPDDTARFHGLPLSGAPITFGSPVIAELDGSSGNGKEVVVGGSDGRLYARRSDGTALWEKSVPIAGCSSETLIFGKPTVGALYGDGAPIVVIGYGDRSGATGRGCDGGVVAYRGSDGQQVWNFSQKAFDAVSVEGTENMYGVITAAALADTDGDGKLEVAFGGLDRNVYLLNHDGTLRWYYHAADSVWSTPLFMNIDGDPQLELIVGTDISANPNLNPPTQSGGFVYAFETAARSPARIPFQTGYMWRTFFEQVIYSSPLAGDLLPNNPGLEIAVGSGCYWPVGATPVGRWVKLIRPSDGSVLQTLNAPGCVQSSPAAGDIDDDGQLEIVATTRGTDGKGHIVAWDPTNPSPKWDKITGDPNSGLNDANVDMQSPVIADLDGNGSLEVLASNFWSVHVLSGKDGAFLTDQGPGNDLPSLFTWYTLKSTPAVGDINNDGKLDVVIGGSNDVNGGPNRGKAHLYAWTNFAGVINSPAGGQAAYSAPWPQFRRDALANGALVEPGLTTSAPSVSTIVERGEKREYRIFIGSTDGSSISLSASEESDPNNIVGVSISDRTLLITINSADKPNGTYSASVKVDSNGLPTKTIPVAVRIVGSVSRSLLPEVVR